jgi:hypothetical protein
MAREQGDINIARIPVSGIGGLGMVAAAHPLAVQIGVIQIELADAPVEVLHLRRKRLVLLLKDVR